MHTSSQPLIPPLQIQPHSHSEAHSPASPPAIPGLEPRHGQVVHRNEPQKGIPSNNATEVSVAEAKESRRQFHDEEQAEHRSPAKFVEEAPRSESKGQDKRDEDGPRSNNADEGMGGLLAAIRNRSKPEARSEPQESKPTTKAEAKGGSPDVAPSKSEGGSDWWAANASSLGAYMRMISVGVPIDSVAHKMRASGEVSEESIKRFQEEAARQQAKKEETATKEPEQAKRDPPMRTPPTAEAKPLPKVDKETLKSDPVLGPFVKMASMGVPAPSVRHKMIKVAPKARRSCLTRTLCRRMCPLTYCDNLKAPST